MAKENGQGGGQAPSADTNSASVHPLTLPPAGPVDMVPHIMPESAGEKVVVACKLPGGLMIHADKMVRTTELTMTGTREVDKAMRASGFVRLNGSAVPYGFIPKWLIENGYGFTPGVSREIWDAWQKSNANSPMWLNGLVAAFHDEDSARAWAKENASRRTGMEPMVPDNDVRSKQLLNPGIVDFGTDKDRMNKSGNTPVAL